MNHHWGKKHDYIGYGSNNYDGDYDHGDDGYNDDGHGNDGGDDCDEFLFSSNPSETSLDNRQKLGQLSEESCLVFGQFLINELCVCLSGRGECLNFTVFYTVFSFLT